MTNEDSKRSSWPKWLTRPVIIAAIITGFCGLMAACVAAFGPEIVSIIRDLLNQSECPTIEVVATPKTIPVGGTSSITVIADSPGGGAITYIWEATRGTVPSEETDQQTIKYRAPDNTGPDTIKVTARNIPGCPTTDAVEVFIVQSPSPTQ